MSQSFALRHIALGIHFVAQQALCDALGASRLHWVGRYTLRLALFSGRAGRAYQPSRWADTRIQPVGYGGPYPAARMADGALACDASGKTKARD
jgi:hypothetical protein